MVVNTTSGLKTRMVARTTRGRVFLKGGICIDVDTLEKTGIIEILCIIHKDKKLHVIALSLKLMYNCKTEPFS